jgi:hypothetical protein
MLTPKTSWNSTFHFKAFPNGCFGITMTGKTALSLNLHDLAVFYKNCPLVPQALWSKRKPALTYGQKTSTTITISHGPYEHGLNRMFDRIFPVIKESCNHFDGV